MKEEIFWQNYVITLREVNMPNIPIFLASDNNYAPFVATTIASICDNTKSSCDFYILDGGISEKNKAEIYKLKNSFDNFSIEFLQIDLQKEFASVVYKNISNYVSLSTYNRFLIPKLKPDLHKVLYLDVDIIVNCDIIELYNQDLKNYILGAIPEKYVNKLSTARHLTDLKLCNKHKYFNAGILLIDNKAWLNENILQKALDVEKEYRNKLSLADQDILNIIFNNNYKELPLQYNYMNENAYFEKDNLPLEKVIRHYNGPLKPWNINEKYYNKINLVKNIEDFWKYAIRTPFYDFLQSQVQDENKQQKLLLNSRVQNMILKQYAKKDFNNV